jgi:hypothetical protein
LAILFGMDAKPYSKYNAVDSEVNQQACHDVICSESAIAEEKRVLFHDLVSKQQNQLEADEVCLQIFMLCFLLVWYLCSLEFCCVILCKLIL